MERLQTLSKAFKVKNILIFLTVVFVSHRCQNLPFTHFKYVRLTGYSAYLNKMLKVLFLLYNNQDNDNRW